MNEQQFKDFIAENMRHNHIEASIVRRVVKALRENGTPVASVWDSEEDTPVSTKQEIFEQVFNLDECFLMTADRSWVRIVLGNEQDCIVDYTIDLEDALKPVNEYIDRKWG